MDNESDCYSRRFSECIQSNGLTQHVQTPTHTSGHILDLILTRNTDGLNVSEPTADYFISDHSFVTCCIEQCRPPLIRKTVTSRNWKSVCIDDMKNDLAELRTIGNESCDTDTLVRDLTDRTTHIVDKHAPRKERNIVCRPDIPWYSDYLKHLKHYKRSIEKIHMKHKSPLTKDVYKKVRNNYIKEAATAKSSFYQSVISDAEGNVKKLYSVTSKLLGREKENPLPSCSNDVDLANDFLQYFSNKIKKLRAQLDNIPSETEDQLYNTQSHPCISRLKQFKSLSETDVKKLILNSKSTTCELDFIPTRKLKENIEYFLPAVTEIVNRSLASGSFPQAWKSAVIRPLLKKKGLPLELKNFRPVSNLSFLSKILEKAALNQITKHIESNKLLPSYQSAYRKNHGVETALLKMYDDLLKAVDDGKVTIVVMIDLSAAFDTIDIPIALHILHEDFGIDDVPLQWIRSYLTDRTMKVIINNKTSEEENLLFGVPQGSCAGPVIFTLYIAALNRVVQNYPVQLHGYADDHKVAIQIQAGNIENMTYALEQLSSCLADISVWMEKYKLKMNNDKTEIILYGTTQQLAKVDLSGINVGGCFVKCVDHVRDLGVLFDANLNFDRHIRKKCQIAYSQLKNLRSIRYYLSQKSTEILVHGLVHSHIDFCNGLFTEVPSYQINRLQRLQNQAARLVLNTYDQPSSSLLKYLHWLPVRARIMFKILVLVHRVIRGSAPTYLESLFTHARRNYRLRSNDCENIPLLVVPRRRTKLADRSISVVGPKWWNALPRHLKNIDSESEFRKKLKTYLFEQFHS